MHREIQIKQFPIVTTHWWPKTRNERFVWENEQYLYSFFTSCTQPVQVIWCRTHPVCVRALWLVGVNAWREGVSEAWCWRNFVGIFLLEDAHCHRSCRFWTVYSRIMMTSFKQTACCHHCISIRALHVSISFICISRQRLTEGVSEAWCFKNYLNCLTVLLYTVMCIPLVQNYGSLILEWHKYYSWTNPSS